MGNPLLVDIPETMTLYHETCLRLDPVLWVGLTSLSLDIGKPSLSVRSGGTVSRGRVSGFRSLLE